MKVKHLWLVLPLILWFVGSMMNQAAVYANGGHMPVYLPGWDCSLISEDGPFHPDWNHACMTHATHLKFLGDWIIGNDGVSSLGDLVLEWGGYLKIPSLLAWAGLMVRDMFVKKQESK